MSRAHSAAPVAEAPDLEAAVAVVRSHGLRASAARRLVLQALYLDDEPLTVERIAGGVGGRLPGSDPGSVYRNLETLEAIGLVRHVHLGHGPALYVRADAGAREYLQCEACGTVRAVEPAELEGVRELIRERLGHHARFTHFPIGGLCGDCATDDGEESAHAHP